MKPVYITVIPAAVAFGCICCELPQRTEEGERRPEARRSLSEDTLPRRNIDGNNAAVTVPMYANHDQKAFRKWGEKMGVKVSVLGPPADGTFPTVNILEEK